MRKPEKTISAFLSLPVPLLITISMSILLFLGIYGIKFNKKNDLATQQQLISAAGTEQEICISYLTVISKNGNKFVGADRRGRTYNFHSNGYQPQVQRTYAFSGKMTKDRVIILSDMTEYPFRSLKYYFSSLSVFLVLYLLIRFVRIRKNGFQLYINVTSNGK